MPLLTGIQQIAIKQEASAGTAETLVAGNVVLNKGDASFESDIPMVPREGMSASLDSFGSVVGTKAAKIRFAMFLRGTSGAPVASSNEPDFSVPFKGCGMAITVSGTNPNQQSSFKPSSTTISNPTTGAYCTVGAYKNGKLYMIHGAQGNLVLTFNNGEPVLAEFEFSGLFNTPTDASLLVPTYTSIVEPPFLSAALSIQGYTTARIKSLKVDLGNRIAYSPYPNGSTGFAYAQIVGRNVTGSFDPEELLAATKNFWNEWLTGAVGSITTGVFPSTGSNYNQFQLNLPAAAYTKVGLADRDGMLTAPVEFEARRNSSAGDDSIELIQT